MKLTNGEISQAVRALPMLTAKEMPVKTAFALAKMANKLNAEAASIEQVRIGLVKKYGTEDKATGRLTVDQQSVAYASFSSDMDELMAQETEVVIEKVRLPESIFIEPQHLMALERFIEC